MLTIVILNYNGWSDTIACLESLRKQRYSALRVIVADNGSSDGSLDYLCEWHNSNSIACTYVHEGETAEADSWLYILPLHRNYGFAVGTNKAIQAMSALRSDYILCLNNDTIVSETCLERLVAYADAHTDVAALTPAIRLYSQPDIMWNAGGRLTFGGRRYYCCMQPAERLSGKQELDISFVTGCALMVRPELVCEGKLFTEKFFFGEEDYDFSLRLQQSKKRIVCLLTAIIYHKVSASTKAFASYNKLFVHSLNRSINLRLYYSRPKYLLWQALFYPYLDWRFLRGLSLRERRQFISLLKQESADNDGVSYDLYNKYIKFPFRR